MPSQYRIFVSPILDLPITDLEDSVQGGDLKITCIYCGKKLMQPILKNNNKNYHLGCYMKKDGSKIFTKSVLDEMGKRLDDMGRRIEFMGEVCDNALDNKLSPEEQEKKY